MPLRVSDRKTEVVGAETDFSVVPDVKAAAGSLAGRSVGGKGRIAVPGHRDLYRMTPLPDKRGLFLQARQVRRIVVAAPRFELRIVAPEMRAAVVPVGGDLFSCEVHELLQDDFIRSERSQQFRQFGHAFHVRVGDGGQENQPAAPLPQFFKTGADAVEYSFAAHRVMQLARAVHRDEDPAEAAAERLGMAAGESAVRHDLKRMPARGEALGQLLEARIQQRFSAPEGDRRVRFRLFRAAQPETDRQLFAAGTEHSLVLPAEAAGEIAAAGQLEMNGLDRMTQRLTSLCGISGSRPRFPAP